MIAIVTLNEQTNVLAIISILISMFSVASKSFVFAVAASYNIKTLIWCWLCAVLDFFSIFFAASWVFDNHEINNNEKTDGLNNFKFNLIGNIWFYKIIICVLPGVLYGSICCYIVGYNTATGNFTYKFDPLWDRILTRIGIIFIVTLLWSVI